MTALDFVFLALILFLATCNTAFSKDVRTLKVPEECRDKEFCSIKPKFYEELEHKINAALPPILKQEHNDRIRKANPSQVKLGLSPKSDWHNCPYVTEVEPLYLFFKDKNHTEMDIIVQTKLFSQNVTIVRCASERELNGATMARQNECFQDFNLNLFSLQSTCKTIYANRQLQVYNTETKKIKKKSYRFPVCCSCVIDRIW